MQKLDELIEICEKVYKHTYDEEDRITEERRKKADKKYLEYLLNISPWRLHFANRQKDLQRLVRGEALHHQDFNKIQWGGYDEGFYQEKSAEQRKLIKICNKAYECIKQLKLAKEYELTAPFVMVTELAEIVDYYNRNLKNECS